MLKNTVSGGEEGVEKVLEVLLELQHQLSTVYNPMQELLGHVDAENNTVYNAIVSIHCISRAFSLLLSHYLIPITFSLLSLSRHYHFLATACLEFPPSLV